MAIALPTILASIKLAVSIVGAGKIAILPFLLAAIAYFHYDEFDPENRPVDRVNLDTEYDFIVVGGGSAGSVIANRLSEVPHWKVLLLEAGGHENEITDVPILSLYLHKSKVDWGYKTEPSLTACGAMIENRCSWTRGKVLGGSSVLNTMLYIRGNRRDFDHWSELGNPGWSYSEVLPYFKKSEDNRNPYLSRNTRYHSTGGYLTIQEAPYTTPVGAAFLDAAQEMGYSIRDINGEFQTGFAWFQYTMRRGTRCSTSKAFLRPVRLRRNLHISLFTHVTRVLIHPQTNIAYGVEYVRGDPKIQPKRTVLARKEVILSAGAINTPQLLMLSGIGPGQHLREKNVRVIHDSPGVGQNLQDHIAMGGITFLIDPPVSLVINRLVNLNTALRYAIKEDGPLTSSIGIEVVGFISTKYANKSDDWPDIEFMATSTTAAADGGTQVKRAHGLTDTFYNKIFADINYRDSFGVLPMILRPKSRGEIKLRSSNPFDYPLLYHNYLTNAEDVRVLREGVKAAIAYGQTNAMRMRFGARLYEKPIPKCEHLPQYTDAYWECAVRQYTLSIYHYSCTAKMGPEHDPYAVVDSKLRVYGVSGLRVIDASVMPAITSGNINAPVIMIGEKGADLIKEYWASKLGRKKRHPEVVYNAKICNETCSRIM